jgi:hypothetical protein
MSTNLVFVGWDNPNPGRERQAGELFQEFHQYLGGLQKSGAIDTFQTVLLDPHGGDLSGFVLIQADHARLDALIASEAWGVLITRCGLLLRRLGVIRGATGDLVGQWMAVWNNSIPA